MNDRGWRGWRGLGILGMSLLILGLGLAGGILLYRYVLLDAAAPGIIPASAAPDFTLMAEAWNTIQEHYVDRAAVQPTPLTYGAISGMTDALGDTGHSRFLDPQMVKEQANFTAGEVVGIGVYVEMKEGHAVIVAPIDGSPAQKAGLRPGDIILKVNGQSVTGLPLDQITALITGPAGTSVTLTILSAQTGQTRDVTMVRTRIAVENVVWAQVPGTTIAHLRVRAFSQGVTNDLRRELAAIQQQGLNGLVFDLRDDPGGLLEEAVGSASQFVTSGNVLLEKDAQGRITPVPVQPGGLAPGMPMVTLVNGGTASAAEIVAGALQDAQRSQLVGETTFGTGTVLEQFGLSDGSALLLAVEEWLTPNGNIIWHKGLQPNVAVTLPSGATPLFPAEEQGMTAAQLQSSQDTQLLRALDLLARGGQ